MTDKDGKILPECAGNIAVLQNVTTTLNTSVAALQAEVANTREGMIRHTSTTENLNAAVEKLVQTIEDQTDAARDEREDHENNCPFYGVAKELGQKDITQKFKLGLPSVTPNRRTSSSPEKKELEKWKVRLMQAIVAFLIAATSVIGTVAATQ